MAKWWQVFTRSKPLNEGFGGYPFGAGNIFSWFGGGLPSTNHSNVLVTAETANKVSAFYSCVRNISEDIAKLPFKVYAVDANGNRTEYKQHVAARLLGGRPNRFTLPVTLITLLLDRALRKGNGYAFIDRDNDGYPIALYFLETETVTPILYNRNVYYRVSDPLQQIEGTFGGESILHIRGMGNGVVGLSVLSYAAESVGKTIATQDYAGKFYGSGANMTGLLTFTGMKDEASIAGGKTAFLNSFKNDGIAAINGNTTFTKMNFSADEAQMLGASEFGVKEMARWFRMPLSKLQTSDTIANIEALAIEYVNDCLEPWIVRIEQEVIAKLFTEKERGYMFCNFDTFQLIKGDTAAMERRSKTLFYVGAYGPNDVLRSIGQNTIGPEGDKKYIPVNMIPADQVEEFWKGKTTVNISTGSPDPSGSGANNGNINNE
jgi:HK97 family phage portal protein